MCSNIFTNRNMGFKTSIKLLVTLHDKNILFSILAIFVAVAASIKISKAIY